ncbi:MAG: hypothetical protein IJ957_03000, partial [Rikenellaceae bacterium]|nr:hypothetical protein [Rikenellaceae bacterium]
MRASPPYLNKINARDPKIIAKIGKYNSEFKIQDSKFPPYGRVLLFSVLRVVFGLQNQHPLSEPTPCAFFAIWAGFTVFGLFSTYLII